MPLACFDANGNVSTHWEHNRRTIPLVCFNLLLNLKQLPAKKPFNHQVFFRRETVSGFHPWGKVVSPRKRVAEGLCGWRHRNSFPMTQSAQSLRQMRSIPRCSKVVFYVFVFDYIHDSATMHNLSPRLLHR